MKIKNLYIALGLSLVAGLGFTACSDDDNYDVEGNPDNLVFLSKMTQKNFEGTIYHTPVGDFGSAKASFPAQIQRVSSQDVIIGAEADTSYISSYNETHGTEYIAAPDDVLKNLQIKTATIEAGNYTSTDSVEVEVQQSDFAKLTESGYLIPLRLTATGATGSQEQGVAYLVVKTGNNFLSFSPTSVTVGVVNTPVGVFGGINAQFQPSSVIELGVDMTVSLKADMSLVDEYNTANSTTYAALPDDVVSSLTVQSVTIPSTSTTATEKIVVTAPDEKAKALEVGEYLLPMRPVVSANGTEAELDDPVYIIVKVTQTLINDDASSILGTVQSDHSAWTCVSATNLNPDEFQNAFQSGWSGGWSFTQTRVSSASFTVDLGSVHKVSAFMFDSYVMNSAHVYLSTDNSNWTDVGDTSGHGTVRDDNWNDWYVFYGGVSARYMKVELNLNANSWAWSWYGTLKFNLAFDE